MSDQFVAISLIGFVVYKKNFLTSLLVDACTLKCTFTPNSHIVKCISLISVFVWFCEVLQNVLLHVCSMYYSVQ